MLRPRPASVLLRHALTTAMGLIASADINGQGNPNPSPAMDAFILGEMAMEHFPGTSTVIVKDGRIVWIESYGLADVENGVPVNDSTLFMLASVSKLFTATAAMQLVEAGTIALDDAVGPHLPWDLHVPQHPGAPITFRQLMTHTASIDDNPGAMLGYYGYPDPDMPLAACMEGYFAETGSDYDAALNFLPDAPGTAYHYANMATALNGHLVERAGGLPFDAHCQHAIFGPLCMGRTAWSMAALDSGDVARPHRYLGGDHVPYPHYGFADYPDGQLRSSVTDLAHFMIAMLNGGQFGDQAVLAAATIDEMWTPQIPALQDRQGLNWYKEVLYHGGTSTWLWGHSGGSIGVSTDLYVDPATGIGVCVLTNGEGDARFICDGLYAYALTLDAATGHRPACLTTHVGTVPPPSGTRVPVRLIDMLGRETPLRARTPLLRVFSDGSVERVFILEQGP